jgi:diguanylate cyclase (GGDEF)-like protein
MEQPAPALIASEWAEPEGELRGRLVPHPVTEPSRRALRWWPLTDLSCLVAVALVAWLLPRGHGFTLPGAVVAIAAYAIGDWVRVPVRQGYGTASQPAFVVMLFCVPLNLVPAIVMGVELLARLPLYARHGNWRGLPMAIGDCWFALPPTIILALAAPGPVQYEHWPVYLAAFAAQFATDLAAGAVRSHIESPGEHWIQALAPGELPIALDALLTLAGLLIARDMQQSPIAASAALVGLLGVFMLMSVERRARMLHESRALHDPLTGLPNRALFAALLEAAVRRSQRSGHTGAVLFADVDHFKAVNDTYGHCCGDEVLRAVAGRMSAVVRRADIVSRWSGDEFAVLLSEQSSAPDADTVATKLRAAFAEPLELPGGRSLTVGLSVGVHRFSGHDSALALAQADDAMYCDKRERALSR